MQDQLKCVQQIQATLQAFAAILSDRSVVTWGEENYGGDSGAVQDQLKGVQQIQASLEAWGDADHGGDSHAVQDQPKGVQHIQAFSCAFAAILSDGSVVTRGDAKYGGDGRAVQDQLNGVQQIQASRGAFAAIVTDGSVVTWGRKHFGGDSRAVQDQLKGVQQIQASLNGAFAAIQTDGSIVTWGHPDFGSDVVLGLRRAAAIGSYLDNTQPRQSCWTLERIQQRLRSGKHNKVFMVATTQRHVIVKNYLLSKVRDMLVLQTGKTPSVLGVPGTFGGSRIADWTRLKHSDPSSFERRHRAEGSNVCVLKPLKSQTRHSMHKPQAPKPEPYLQLCSRQQELPNNTIPEP